MIRTALTVLMLTATPLAALTQEQTAVCTALGGLAQQIMEARQMGVPLSQMIAVLPPEEDQDATQAMILRIVVNAYDAPRYSTDTYQRIAAMDYRNEIETMCFQAALK
jgi:hypothetical protein